MSNFDDIKALFEQFKKSNEAELADLPPLQPYMSEAQIEKIGREEMKLLNDMINI